MKNKLSSKKVTEFTPISLNIKFDWMIFNLTCHIALYGCAVGYGSVVDCSI